MNNFYQREVEDVIGIRFNEPSLLMTALTHSSYANQHRDEAYNERLFQELWDKYAEGTVPHWNMEALCYYDGEHELERVNEKL